MSSALEDIRVIDFGQYLAGPLTAMFLADFGADVVRVDPPGGPRWNHPVNAALQRGKRSIVLDLKEDADLAVARRLVDAADVVIEGFRPGVMERLGLAAESFLSTNPHLIWCSLPGFGRDDPRAAVPAWEGVVSSAASLYPRQMFAVDGDPWFSALPLASSFAAFVASHRIAAALVARYRWGNGDRIEVPLFDASFEAISALAEVPTSRALEFGTLARFQRANVAGFHRGADGRYFEVDAPPRGAQALLQHFLPEADILTADDDEVSYIRTLFDEVWPQRTAAEWERFGQEELKAAVGVVRTSEEWLEDEHAADSKCVVAIDDPELGKTRQGGFPVLLSRTEPTVSSPRHPLDSDREEILRELPELDSKPVLRAGSSVDSQSRLPLAGVRVLDASILFAGPSATRILAQYGAEVIKIDSSEVPMGDINPLSDDPSCLFGHRTVNAGKRMMFLNLKTAAGQRVLRRMMGSLDVVHHVFTPPVAERLGLSLEEVRRSNADIIYSSTLLHSIGGHRAGYRGHDMLAQHGTGISERLGGDGPPLYAGLPINDNACPHLSAFGLLVALFHRYRTGETQEVNSSLSRTATMLQMPYMMGFDGRRRNEPRGPDALGWGAFDRLYRANDGWFYFADHGPGTRDKVASVAGLDSVSDVGDSDIEEWLEERLAKRSVAEWVDVLNGSGIGAHRYTGLAERLAGGITWDRRLLTVEDHPGIGKAIGMGVPLVGKNPNDQRPLVARRPGMDTIDILEENGLLDELPDLLRKHIVAVGEDPIVRTTSVQGYWDNIGNVFLASGVDHVGETHDAAISSIFGGKAMSSIFWNLSARVKST